MLFCSVNREQGSRYLRNNYVMMLLPLPSTPTALHRRPNLPAGQCNLTGGQNPSVSVIYTVDVNVDLNPFNDFNEGEQYHCNLLCQRRYKHSNLGCLQSIRMILKYC